MRKNNIYKNNIQRIIINKREKEGTVKNYERKNFEKEKKFRRGKKENIEK